MYQAFGDHPDANLPEAHESRLLWNWVATEKPALWMNFHCFTGWRLNSEFPYDGWYEVEDYGLFSDAGQRRLYAALCDTMRLETDGPSTHERASIHRPNTLCYQFAKRFDIPHAFYEINNGTAGKHLRSAAGNSRLQTCHKYAAALRRRHLLAFSCRNNTRHMAPLTPRQSSLQRRRNYSKSLPSPRRKPGSESWRTIISPTIDSAGRMVRLAQA